ncbi:MAG: response regulator transcription factor [Lachnospiraceae bacterium]|nr:response regulator transcription factor [Lachnospiraceae bacterium]
MAEIYYTEDDANIAQIVKEYLEQKHYKVTLLGTIAEAEEALCNHLPSLILVDWNMPDGRGDSLCRWIRSRWKELPVIFLTVRGDSHDIVCGFADGADDYVVKPFELEVLYSRIMALLRRTGDVSKQYLTCDGIMIDTDRMLVTCEAEEVSVSAIEYQLLLFLMENKGKTVTRDRILEQIWDAKGNYVNDNTLTVTMKRLREKLNQPSCLKTVRSVGYRMEDTI